MSQTHFIWILWVSLSLNRIRIRPMNSLSLWIWICVQLCLQEVLIQPRSWQLRVRMLNLSYYADEKRMCSCCYRPTVWWHSCIVLIMSSVAARTERFGLIETTDSWLMGECKDSDLWIRLTQIQPPLLHTTPTTQQTSASDQSALETIQFSSYHSIVVLPF